MLIESLKLKTPKNPNIFICLVAGNEYALHSDVIVKYGLTKGKNIDDRQLNLYIDESMYIICLNQATNYISSHLKTKKQLKDYLYLKGYTTPIIKRVLDKLEEYNVLNDDLFATEYICANENKLSKRNLETKLASKGISKEILSDKLLQVDDRELCDAMAKKFMKNKTCDKKTYEKLVRHLQYKGFGFDNIMSTLKDYKSEIE